MYRISHVVGGKISYESNYVDGDELKWIYRRGR